MKHTKEDRERGLLMGSFECEVGVYFQAIFACAAKQNVSQLLALFIYDFQMQTAQIIKIVFLCALCA